MNIYDEIQKLDDEISLMKVKMTELQTEIFLSKKDEVLSEKLQESLNILRSEWKKKLLQKHNLEKQFKNNNLKGGKRR